MQRLTAVCLWVFFQFMACLIVIFLGEIVGGVLAIIFKDSVSYMCYVFVIIYYKICIAHKFKQARVRGAVVARWGT